jgi:microcystin-dependent protein
MATVTKGRTFVSGEVVTPTKLNTLVDSATVTQIQTADISDAQITTAKIADGAITGSKLNSSVILVPTGAVMPFAMNAAPTGWLAADGTAVSRATFSLLFAAIGTLYGAGDGSTTFNLPDLRASFVRGAGSDGVATAGTFGAKQADSVIDHTHSGRTGNDSPDHTHNYSRGLNAFPYAATGSVAGHSTFTTVASGGASTRHQHDFTTSSQSPAGATETRPRNIAMLYCIKF